MTIARFVLSLVAVLALAPAGASLAQKPKESPPDYFPLRAGDSWSYRSTTADGKTSEFTMKVLDAADGVYHVRIESGFPIEEWYTKPAGKVVWQKESYVKSNQTVTFDPARQYLQNPLGSGGAWAWKGKGNMGVDIDESSTVAGSESVTVPAGTFSATKVVSKVIQGGATVTKTY